MNPPSQSLSHILFLGATSSLGLYYYHVLMSCFTALFMIACGAPVLFWNPVPRFRGIDKPSHTFGFPVVYSRRHKPLVPFRSRPTSSRVALWGGPLKSYMNLVNVLS